MNLYLLLFIGGILIVIVLFFLAKPFKQRIWGYGTFQLNAPKPIYSRKQQREMAEKGYKKRKYNDKYSIPVPKDFDKPRKSGVGFSLPSKARIFSIVSRKHNARSKTAINADNKNFDKEVIYPTDTHSKIQVAAKEWEENPEKVDFYGIDTPQFRAADQKPQQQQLGAFFEPKTEPTKKPKPKPKGIMKNLNN